MAFLDQFIKKLQINIPEIIPREGPTSPVAPLRLSDVLKPQTPSTTQNKAKKTMVFEVGAGMTPEQTQRAEEIIRKPATEGQGFLDRFVREVTTGPTEVKPAIKLPGILGKVQQKIVDFMAPESVDKRVARLTAEGMSLEQAAAKANADYQNEYAMNMAAGVAGGMKLVKDISVKGIQQIAKSGVVDNIVKILKKETKGLADDAIKPLANKLKDITDPVQIKNVVDDALRSPLEKIDTMFAGKKTTQAIKDRIVQTGQQLQTDWTDSFAPIKRLTQKAEEISGTKVLPEQDPYTAARLFAGSGGKVDLALDRLGNILKTGGTSQDALSKYLTLERMAERAERGFANPGGITAQQARQGLSELRRGMSLDLWANLQNTAKRIYQYGDDLLRISREAGIIDDETYKVIKEKNQRWAPFDVIEYLENKVSDIPAGKKGFSVASQNIVKTLEGTEKEIANPLESLIRRTYQVINLAERNNVAKKIIDLRKVAPEMNEVIKPIKFGETDLNAVPKGFQKISVFEGGTKVDYAVPEEIAQTITGANRQTADLVTKIGAGLAKVFRAGTTTLNAGFFIPNAIRDFQSAAVNAKYGFNFTDYVKGFMSVIKQDKYYKLWQKSGGTFATRMDVFRGQPAQKALKNITEGTAKKVIKTIVNPIKLLSAVGEVVEETPRLGVFRKALQKGAGTTEAALESRQATVDFAKSGVKMKVVNSMVPYLNARLQGTLNLARVLKERPVSAGLKIAGTVIAPTTLAYLWNRQQPSWDKIPQWEKDNYWIIVTGEFKNSDGETAPSYIKVPKGDIGRVFGNPVESALQFADKKDAKSIDRLALEMFSDVSPITFYSEGKWQGGQAASAVLPPAPKTGVELLTNKSLFTGSSIVPRSKEKASPKYQYGAGNTETMKMIGQALNISPAKWEYAIKGILGTAAAQPLQLSDFVLRKAGAAQESELTPQEKLMYAPVAGRFFGARTSEGEKELDKLSDLEREAADRAIEKEIEAKDIISILKKGNLEQVAEAQKNIDEDLRDKIRDLIRQEALGISYEESKLKNLPIKERAKYIISKINELENESDIQNFVLRMKSLGLITTETRKEMRLILANP